MTPPGAATPSWCSASTSGPKGSDGISSHWVTTRPSGSPDSSACRSGGGRSARRWPRPAARSSCRHATKWWSSRSTMTPATWRVARRRRVCTTPSTPPREGSGHRSPSPSRPGGSPGRSPRPARSPRAGRPSTLTLPLVRVGVAGRAPLRSSPRTPTCTRACRSTSARCSPRRSSRPSVCRTSRPSSCCAATAA